MSQKIDTSIAVVGIDIGKNSDSAFGLVVSSSNTWIGRGHYAAISIAGSP